MLNHSSVISGLKDIPGRFCRVIVVIGFMALPYFTYAQEPRMVKWNELESILNHPSDSTYVINFWATWCKPCIKELPYFDRLTTTFAGSKLRVILVSLDFKRQFETTLKTYVQKHKVRSEVLLIDEPDYDTWIDKVDPSWSGAIPATLVINSKKGLRNFYEREFTEPELKQTIKPLLP